MFRVIHTFDQDKYYLISLILRANSTVLPPTAVYIHLPFCRRRCYYCDFPIAVVGDKGGSAATWMIQEYLTALIQDIQQTEPTGQSLKTIFFGGGTPSLLSAREIAQILTAIASQFDISSDAEISMEIDPGTFDREQLQGYLTAGVNRFSLGVQSFEPELLKICGRSHTIEDVFTAIETIRQLNINNFSLDLISGLPNQTPEACLRSLQTAIAIAPKHLSGYDLVLEPVTAFGKQYQPGATPLPNDDDTAQMYRLTQKTLTEAGYEHYEVSNYALPGYQCRHNRVYWENKPYYGFGMGAASYVAGQRFTRPRTRQSYYQWLQEGAIIDTPVLTPTDYLLETLMLGLRLAEGIKTNQFDAEIWQQIWSCLQPYYRQGWIEILDANSKLLDVTTGDRLSSSAKRIRLSDPEGFLFSNTILASLFEKLEIDY